LSFIALAQIQYSMKTQLVKNIAIVFAMFISSVAFAQHDHGSKSDTSKASHKHECQMKKGGSYDKDKAMSCCGKGKMKKGKAMSCHSGAKSDSTKHDHSNHEGMMDKKKKSTSCH
jgi:hypothetical protein